MIVNILCRETKFLVEYLVRSRETETLQSPYTPRRKKPVIAMVVLMLLMFGVIIFCDVYYSNLIMTALTRAENPIVLDASTIYIAQAYNVLQTHIVILGVGVALILLLPLYTKLLRKINTSVTVEDYGKLEAIDISGED